MIKFILKLRAVTFLTVGGGLPELIGVDVAFIRVPIENEYKLYIPGSSVKGALRTSTSRIAEYYGFKSCGEIEPGKIIRTHRNKGLCDVCKLFGYPGREHGESSPLLVSDFKPEGEVKVVDITHTSINNKTLTALEGALYTIEHVVPGTIFSGVISLREDVTSLLPLLLLGVAELRTSRFGLRSLVDLRIEDNGELDKYVDVKWKPLLSELRKWLWEGIT